LGRVLNQAPDLAEKERALFYRTGAGEALLATVREDDPPRVHPIAECHLAGQWRASTRRIGAVVNR
jgi:hypothetical protein